MENTIIKIKQKIERLVGYRDFDKDLMISLIDEAYNLGIQVTNESFT